MVTFSFSAPGSQEIKSDFAFELFCSDFRLKD
jgi:hypothetical protein